MIRVSALSGLLIKTRRQIVIDADQDHCRHGLHRALVGSNDNIDFSVEQLPDCSGNTFRLLFPVQILRDEILAFNIADGVG